MDASVSNKAAGSRLIADQGDSASEIASYRLAPAPEHEASHPIGQTDDELAHVFELPFRLGPVKLWTSELNLPFCEMDDSLFAGEECAPVTEMPSCSASVEAVPDPDMARPTVSLRDGQIEYVHHRYVRCWVDVRGSFDAYQSRCLSAKMRSDIRRQKKRFLQQTGEDVLDVRYYQTPAEVSEFSALAEQISARTFQEQKAGCG
ncbi:MAG: hypothetical protein ACR2P3_08950, partial [Geminicoccaceae bacterium]